MKLLRLYPALIALMVMLVPTSSYAKNYTIEAGARAFKTPILYVQPGDKVQFTNMTSHNTVTVDELVPEGADGWSSAMGENISIKLDVPGIYSYVCVPHIGFGMVGVIVVGDVTEEDLEAYKKKAQDTLEGPYRRLLGKIIKIEPTN